MAQQDLQTRVEHLERQMEILAQMPGRLTALESQIPQFREEMRSEFSALRLELRAEIRAGDEATRQAIREEIRSTDEATRQAIREEIRSGDEATRQAIRADIRTEIGDLRGQMLLLHEEVIARIKLLGETGRGRSKRR